MPADVVRACSMCGKAHDLASWQRLAFVGYQVTEPRPDPDDAPDDVLPNTECLELRNCGCGTTISRRLTLQGTLTELGRETWRLKCVLARAGLIL